MIIQEINVKSQDGLNLSGKCWKAEQTKAVICLVHGLGEHIGRYSHVADFFNKQGISVLGFDLRGHGKSEGRRGHTPSYEILLDDISLLLKQAASIFPGLPLFLYGHSMGGNLVLNYSLRKKGNISGVIASSPWLKLAFDPPAVKVALAKMVNGIFPAFTQPSNLEIEALSRNPEVVAAYKNDPLVHDKISSNMFLSGHNSGLWALEHAHEFSYPLLLFHGTGDRITSHKASEEFSSKIKANVAFKLWEGFYHETHNEAEKALVFESIRQWIFAKI